MANYHVVSRDKGWQIVGVKSGITFRTKKDAIRKALQMARSEKKSIIIHSKDGEVSEVISFDEKISSGRLLSANVKHRLSGENVRNSIAGVISERKGIK